MHDNRDQSITGYMLLLNSLPLDELRELVLYRLARGPRNYLFTLKILAMLLKQHEHVCNLKAGCMK